MKLIGEILVENGLLEQKDLAHALELQKGESGHRPIGEILISLGLINIQTLMDYLDIQIRDNR